MNVLQSVVFATPPHPLPAFSTPILVIQKRCRRYVEVFGCWLPGLLGFCAPWTTFRIASRWGRPVVCTGGFWALIDGVNFGVGECCRVAECISVDKAVPCAIIRFSWRSCDGFMGRAADCLAAAPSSGLSLALTYS